MKKLILLALISFNAFSADYVCQSGMVKMKLSKNLDLIIQDAQTNEYLFNGFVSETLDRDGITDMMYETDSHNFLQLKFKTSALKDEDDKLFGFVRGYTGRGFLDGSVQCQRSRLTTAR